MTVFLNYLKRIFRNKVQAFFILLFPLLFMTIGFVSNEPALKAAVIDNDRTPFTTDLVRQLGSMANIGTVREDEIEQKLRSLNVEYVLVIEPGFTERLIRGESGGITGYAVKESNVSKPASSFIEQRLGAARAVAAAVGRDPDAFYKEMANYDERSSLQLNAHTFKDVQTKETSTVIGLVVVAMLYTALIVSLHVLINRNNHTLHRTLAAPVTMRRYMLQMIGSFVAVAWIQITIVMVFMKWVFNLYFGGAEWDIYGLLLIFSLVGVSFGVAISSLTRNMVQACLFGICIIVPLAMLGGAYFPIEGKSDVIDSLSKLTPVSWVMGGVKKLLSGASLISLGQEISIVLMFAVVFFLIGTFKKADTAK
ncbi:ABC transporter permease [Cohnella sp. AR92]|uniref:ABC transporter permease n=1 Tax=Cohnella sp. AR92 TaxID=648716 RepID=UPI000F8D55C3|nr:ABC transporter permease [Cohnella sp. AR92]RUS47019.1 ABC transporter permease [Cohnella sp. AR92]